MPLCVCQFLRHGACVEMPPPLTVSFVLQRTPFQTIILLFRFVFCFLFFYLPKERGERERKTSREKYGWPFFWRTDNVGILTTNVFLWKRVTKERRKKNEEDEEPGTLVTLGFSFLACECVCVVCVCYETQKDWRAAKSVGGWGGMYTQRRT